MTMYTGGYFSPDTRY